MAVAKSDNEQTSETALTNHNMNSFPNNLPPGWKALLENEVNEDYFRKLSSFLKSEYASRKVIFPARQNILRAIQTTDYGDVKVVILGQDPYHGPGQAIGLSFAVPNSLSRKPPSLVNIFQEIKNDLQVDLNPQFSDLSGWAAQGVLLLNTVLTVRKNEAFSHQGQGWEVFTDKIISHLNNRQASIVFILWGSPARKKKVLITNPRHFILEAAHPSPLSAHKGFFGCQHFSKTNEKLKQWGYSPIKWQNICQN